MKTYSHNDPVKCTWLTMRKGNSSYDRCGKPATHTLPFWGEWICVCRQHLKSKNLDATRSQAMEMQK